MAEITLADYTGYIFNEMIKAREMADAYARQVAEAYAKDPVMKHFSVPRFKVPSMELTIPVLIAGARFKQLGEFRMDIRRFLLLVNKLIDPIITQLRGGVILTEPPRPRAAKPMKGAKTNKSAEVLFKALKENDEPQNPEPILEKGWGEVFFTAMAENDVLDRYRQTHPGNDPFTRTLLELTNIVQKSTVIQRTSIESLLVNPETNVVKNGSDAASVFTIKASIVEEGFYIHTIKDKDTGAERQIVDFE
ncbi:MAG: hypothetical protein ACKVP5_10190 [Aestuariivirga sp.]